MNDKPLRILRRPEVQSRCSLGHSQIDNLEKRGIFPRRVKISERAVGWVESEVEAFLESRVAASRGGMAKAA